jgi:hypothetical protein
MHNKIIQHIRKFITINDIEAEAINKYLERHQYKKKEFILQEQQVCKHLYFEFLNPV